MNFRFSNGIVQISLPDTVDIMADSPEEAGEEYLALLMEVGEVTAFSADGGVSPRLSCLHRTFAARDETPEEK